MSLLCIYQYLDFMFSPINSHYKTCFIVSEKVGEVALIFVLFVFKWCVNNFGEISYD